VLRLLDTIFHTFQWQNKISEPEDTVRYIHPCTRCPFTTPCS